MGREKIILFLIVAVGILLRFVNINQSFWLDEAAQMIESLRPLNEQLDLAADFHPPLYHLLLHFWLYFGKSEIFARLPSVFMGTASIFLTYKIASSLKIKSGSLLAALLLAVSPFHIYYSQEVRPYMLFTFLSAASIYFWLKKDWFINIIFNILLVYSNYFASFLLLGQLITAFLFRKKYLKTQVSILTVTYLFFIPWLPKMFRQVMVGLNGSFTGWTQVVSESALRNVPLTMAKFVLGKASFDNNLIYAFVILPSVIVFIISSYLIRKNKEGKILLSLFYSPFILAIITSFLFPVTAPQRLIFLLPLFLIIISFTKNFLPEKLFVFNYSVIFITSILGLFLYFTNPKFQRENWRQSVNWLVSRVNDNHLVLFAFPQPFGPFLWYNPGRLNGIGIAPEFLVSEKDLVKVRLQVRQKKEIYYYGYLTDLTDPEKKVSRTLTDEGFSLDHIKDFPGVGFVYTYKK